MINTIIKVIISAMALCMVSVCVLIFLTDVMDGIFTTFVCLGIMLLVALVIQELEKI